MEPVALQTSLRNRLSSVLAPAIVFRKVPEDILLTGITFCHTMSNICSLSNKAEISTLGDIDISLGGLSQP
jgi:hypothetical protein